MTWNDIIDRAFENLGVTQVDETITTAMRTNAQKRLNALLSSISTEGLMAYQQISQQFPLIPNVDAYSVGIGGSFATVGRPLRITAWRAYYTSVLRSGGPVLSLAEFGAAAQSMIGEQSAIPKILGADTAYPAINLRIFPPPSANAGTLELDYWIPVAQVTDFTVATGLPDGWERMLHFNLAVDLYPQYPRQGGIPPELAANAQNSKASLVSQNATPSEAPSQQ